MTQTSDFSGCSLAVKAMLFPSGLIRRSINRDMDRPAFLEKGDMICFPRYTTDGARVALWGTSPLLERIPNPKLREAAEIPVDRPELGRAVLETDGRYPGIMDFWP